MFPPQQPGGAPPMGGPPMPKKPMVPPGTGADPMAAMLGQLGPGMLGGPPPMAGPPPSFPAGPNGLPFGGDDQATDDDGDMAPVPDSPLLQGIMGGGLTYTPPTSDPYTMQPGDEQLINQGTGDPNGGMDQLMMLLSLAQMGVLGGPEQPPTWRTQPMSNGVGPGGSGMPTMPMPPDAPGY